jgi:hypothetical protein
LGQEALSKANMHWRRQVHCPLKRSGRAVDQDVHSVLAAARYTWHGSRLPAVVTQVQFILGASGRSYLVGWGNDPPTHIPNPAASCPASVQPCSGYLASSPEYSSPDPNPHTLTGALVSGPDDR